MLPILNIATKGMLKFIYNISTSVGSNLIKFTVKSGLSDSENFLLYFDSKYQAISSQWFKHSLQTMNKQQINLYFNHCELEQVIHYFDECFIDVENRNNICHLIMLTHSLIIIFESYSQIKLLQFTYHHIRKFSF